MSKLYRQLLHTCFHVWVPEGPPRADSLILVAVSKTCLEFLSNNKKVKMVHLSM